MNDLEQIQQSLIQLEIKNSYQEETLTQLNEIVIQQQLQMDNLKQEIKRLETLMLKERDDSNGYDLTHKKPPHY